MNRAKIRHIIAAIYAVTVLLVGTVFMPTASAEDKEYTPPKLVWERTFEGNITAVGVDEDCFSRTNGDINSCLKWILYAGYELRWFGREGELRRRRVTAMTAKKGISANGKYVSVRKVVGSRGGRGWWKPWEGIYHQIFDWNGRTVHLFKDESPASALPRGDGSVVFPIRTSNCQSYLRGVRFLDAWGIPRSIFRLPSLGESADLGLSESFFVLAVGISGSQEQIVLFSKYGRVLWTRLVTGQVFGVTVSDSGEVISYIYREEKQDVNVLVYDQNGTMRDSVPLHLVTPWPLLGTHGRFAFLSIKRYDPPARLEGVFLCYDLDSMKVRFMLSAEDGYSFLGFDADCGARRVAVVTLKLGGKALVRIYDFHGEYKAEVEVEGFRFADEGWFKLLDGALLVAEGNRLRLYEIDVE